MNYKDLIKNWHLKASEQDYFSKFVFEYLAFIAHIKTQRYSSNTNDRQVIQRLKQDSLIKRRYLDKINRINSLKNDWVYIKENFDNAPLGDASRDLNWVIENKWWNCSHNECNQKTYAEKRKAAGVIHSLDDWENMIEFGYSIRNNLFHGAKNPENESDQFAVKYGYTTLRELMEMLINENP